MHSLPISQIKMRTNSVIIKPLVTEKSSQLSKSKVYSFIVNADANKAQVSTILENMYKITVGQVRMTVRKGKMKRVGRQGLEKKDKDVKIAYVTVVNGTIDAFPQS